VAEEEGAGDGVVERVVGSAGGEAGEFVGEMKRGDEVFEGFGRELRVGDSDEAEGVNPLEGMERRDVVEEVALGGDVVRDEDAVLKAREERGPEFLRRGRKREFGAELRVASGRAGVERAVGRDVEEGGEGRGRKEFLATELDEADLPRLVWVAGDVAGGFEVDSGEVVHGE